MAVDEGLAAALADLVAHVDNYSPRFDDDPTQDEALQRSTEHARAALAAHSTREAEPGLDAATLARAIAEVRKSVDFVSRGHTHERLTSDEVAAMVAAALQRTKSEETG